jgi:hypothetical protein
MLAELDTINWPRFERRLDQTWALTREGFLVAAMSAIDWLLERLRTGWSPSADDIAREVPQRDPIDWDFWKSGETLIGYPFDDVG